MDPEVVALMFALGLALVPIGVAFRSRLLRVGLVLCWISSGLVVASGITASLDRLALGKLLENRDDRRMYLAE